MTSLVHEPRTTNATADEVSAQDLRLLEIHAADVKSKAMELTDAWGQAMFILDRSFVEEVFDTLGFRPEVVTSVYDGIRSLGYVEHQRRDEDVEHEVTWHAVDATCLTLRGVVGLETAMATIDDMSVETLLNEHHALFVSLMAVMPDYATNLMFSPEVASTVLATFGAYVSADKLYSLAATYGEQVTLDLEGRRGVSTQFLRSLALTISARI